MKKLDNFSNCLEVLKSADFALAENDEINGKTKRLNLTRLGRGERLLALCLMADETKNTIYISNELTQLDKPAILRLIEMFKNSKYINLVPPTPYNEAIFKSLLQK